MGATHGKFGIVYKWNQSAENLAAEACTESGAQAQITDTAKRLLNPNAAITFADSGGANLLRIDHVRGIGYFDANVTVVTVTGTGAYVLAASLIKTGYLYSWSIDLSVDMADTTAFQAKWKTGIPGQAEGGGSADGYLASTNWYDDVVSGTLYLLRLFTYDPDDDASGDHFTTWVRFSGFNANAPIGDVVKEKIDFKMFGPPAFTANT